MSIVRCLAFQCLLLLAAGPACAATITITAPGNVRICLDLDSSTSQVDGTCIAITPADRSYLQGRWAPASYNHDPYATVGFGIYGAQPKNFIYFRENY